MDDIRELLKQNGCSPEFIDEAMRFSKLYNGDIDAFMDTVEDILMSEEEDDEAYDEDDDLDDEEDDPIFRSDYNYDGNEDNIYFEDGEESFEDDDEEE